MNMIKLVEDHKYQVGGKIFYSVTTIIKETVGVNWDVHQWYLERGTAIHACAKLIAEGKKFKFDPKIAGWVSGIQKFYDEVRPEVLAVELPVVSLVHRFAGTIDLVCKINGVKVIVDFKNSIEMERLKLQLGGYSVAYQETNKDLIVNGFGIGISESGKYSMTKKIDLRIARNEFLILNSAFKIYQRINKGGEHNEYCII